MCILRHTSQGISFAKYDSRQEISRRAYLTLSTKGLTLKTIKHFTCVKTGKGI